MTAREHFTKDISVDQDELIKFHFCEMLHFFYSSAPIWENNGLDFHENFNIDISLDKEVSIKFWKSSDSGLWIATIFALQCPNALVMSVIFMSNVYSVHFKYSYLSCSWLGQLYITVLCNCRVAGSNTTGSTVVKPAADWTATYRSSVCRAAVTVNSESH